MKTYGVRDLVYLFKITIEPIGRDNIEVPFKIELQEICDLYIDRTLKLVPLPYVLCRVQGSYPDGQISPKLYR